MTDFFDFSFDAPADDPFGELRQKMTEIETLVRDGGDQNEIELKCVELSTKVLEIAGLDPKTQAMHETQAEFRKLLDDGKQHECWVCLRTARIWPRSINKTQIKCMISLALLWRELPQDQRARGVLSSDIQKRMTKLWPKIGTHATGEIGKLVHWGLVRQPAKDDKDAGGKTSGRWIPEQRLFDFLAGKIKLIKQKKLLNNNVVEVSDELVHINDEFANFDFDKLMRGEG